MSCSLRRCISWFAFALVLSALAGSAIAQQANVGVPFNQLGNSFFEQSGVGFGIRGPGFFFQQNSFGQALPPFGGFAPDAGANLGFAVNNGPNQAFFNFAFGQGARSSFTSSTPSVTIGNGGFGRFSAGEWTPFVVGAIPIVGDAPSAGGVPFGPAGSPSLLDERLSRLGSEPQTSSASGSGGSSTPDVAVDPTLDRFQHQLAISTAASGPAAMSVARIAERRDAERSARAETIRAEIDGLLAKADAAIESGKPRVARIFLQQAVSRAEGKQKRLLQDRLQAIDSALKR